MMKSDSIVIIDQYNKLTDINNGFEINNYIHSMKFSNNGLILSRIIEIFEQNDYDFEVISGMDINSHYEEVSKFRRAKLKFSNPVINLEDMINNTEIDIESNLYSFEFNKDIVYIHIN